MKAALHERVSRPAKRSPPWLDARTLAMHELMVRKLREEPALFACLQDNLTRWRTTAAPGQRPYLDAWQALVDQGPEACFQVALEASEHGQAMRQCSPFAGVLTNRERWDFLLCWENVGESG